MWNIILFCVLAALFSGFVWMAFAICRFDVQRRKLPEARWKRFVVGAAIILAGMLMLYLTMDFVNMVICILHLLLIWLVCDGVAMAAQKLMHRSFRHYYQGYAAIVLTTVWLAIGWYNAHYVRATIYDVATEKTIPQIRIVGLSDSHVGATFHWPEFEEYIDRINKEKPDVVVIMGDFVDDDTSKEDMEHCSKALGRLKTRYGVYFVYGNHDEGYWKDNGRGYSLANLDRRLEENGVKILRDETASIAGNIKVCGRLDKSRSHDRKSAKALMSDSNPSDYVICLDHEPNDYEAEAESKMDMVISGHTHGGQFLGLGDIGVMIGANDAYYGRERRNGTDFIVSSGIGDWAIKFKTGCISEYIVIDLKGKE